MRREQYGARVLILHHRQTGEWRLPKGKLKPGESAAQAAEREVREEAGLCLRAGRYLGVTHYHYADPLRRAGYISKFVFYFEMDASGQDTVTLEDTFDEARWLPPGEAADMLAWDIEGEMVLRAFRWV